MDGLEKAVADLQGMAMAANAMLEAILMSHPDPDELRDCWTRLSAPRIASAHLDQATKNRAADEARTYYFGKWSEKLDRYHPR